MNRTSIEWVKNPDGTQGYTWNPITGCLNHVNGMCKGGGFPCYAHRLAHGRLKQRYLANLMVAPLTHDRSPFSPFGDSFYPRFWEKRYLADTVNLRTPKGIFVCDMSDLFGIGIPEEWTRKVMERIGEYPSHRFYLLTKQPQNLAKWSPFPENCWVGVTDTGIERPGFAYPLVHLEARIKFISFEPLLTSCVGNVESFSHSLETAGISWVIIGAQTKPTVYPRIEWVQEIVEAADKAGIPVFLKNNLEPLWTLEKRQRPFFKFTRPSPGATEIGKLRQELPE